MRDHLVARHIQPCAQAVLQRLHIHMLGQVLQLAAHIGDHLLDMPGPEHLVAQLIEERHKRLELHETAIAARKSLVERLIETVTQ